MSNQDWSHLGDEIKDAVQSAIDTKDFTRLNDAIGKTVNQALDCFEQALDGNSQNQQQNQQQKNSSFQRSQQWQQYRERQQSERQQQWEQDRQQWGQNRQQWGQRSQGWQGTFHQSDPSSSLRKLSSDPFVRYSDRYSSPTSYRIVGILLSVIGWLLALGCTITEVVLLLVVFTVFSGEFVWGMPVAVGTLIPFLLGGIVMAHQGGRMLKRVKRYKKYVSFLGDKEYCELDELGHQIGLSPKGILKDIRKMILKGWFKQGHLDQQETSLIVTNQAYTQYLEAQKEYKRRELEEKQKQQALAKQDSKRASEKEASQKAASAREQELPEEVRTVIREGREYLRQIKESNDAIPGEEISAKISRLELVIERIFDRVEQHPDLVEELRRFMKYYLPTTVKLLKAYEELDRQEVQGPNIQKSKKEIENTLDTIHQAFENLLDSFFEDTAVDISSDISVMQTLMAQEGLLGGSMKEQMKDHINRYYE